MIYEQLKDDIKDAMKSKDTIRKTALKAVTSRAQLLAKEQNCEITDEITTNAINKELKQLNQTLSSIGDNTGSKLYVDTQKMVEIISTYLPKQMGVDEIEAEIKKIMADNPDVAGGKLTGLVMKSLKGKADNKLIKSCIDSLTT